MKPQSKASELWPQAKPLLLPYDGAASQLYVLDLPVGVLGDCLDIFCDTVSDTTVHTFAGYTFAENDRPAWSKEQRESIISAAGEAGWFVVGGTLAQHGNVTLFIWIDLQQELFDAELVFWSDYFFPDPNDDESCRKSFADLLAISERIRSDHPECECVLSSEEQGDPRDGRDEDWTLFW